MITRRDVTNGPLYVVRGSFTRRMPTRTFRDCGDEIRAYRAVEELG